MTDATPKTVPKPQDLVYNWWKALQADPGDRAELRRARSLEEVVLTPAFHHLRILFRDMEWKSYERIALVAGVLAQVEKEASSKPFGAQLAEPRKGGQGARLSGLRFRRLIQYKTPEEIYQPMLRVVRLLDQTANVKDLSNTLYWWGDRQRRELAFAYYDQAGQEP